MSIKYSLTIMVPTVLLLAASSPAQDDQPVSSIQVLSVGSASPDVASGVASSITRGFSGGGISFQSMGVDPSDRSQLFNLLSNESVRNELKLTEGQFGGVKKIMSEASKRITEMLTQARTQGGGRIQLNGGQFGELMKANRAEAEAAIEEILLPEQLDRIRQLAYQIEVSQEGLGESLVNGRLGREIGVHDDQKQSLTDRAAKIEAEARQAILEIQAAARAKLFKELTPEQRKQAEELLGDYFDYQEPSLGQQLRKRMKSARGEQSNRQSDD